MQRVEQKVLALTEEPEFLFFGWLGWGGVCVTQLKSSVLVHVDISLYII